MVLSDSIPEYRRCVTCGRYVPEAEAHNRLFCSRQCSYVYAACSVCGRYYRKSASDTPPFCSATCTIRYRLSGRAAVAVTDLTASPA